MARKLWRILFAGVLLLALWSAAGSTASAGGGAEVWVNNVRLDSSSPYWKNGDSPASAGDWNAYFDAASSTLTLKDAEITSAYASPAAAMIYADGALNLVLTGASTITRAETVNPTLYGVCALGALSVSGGGSLEIRLNDTADSSVGYGLFSLDTISVSSGSLLVNVDCMIAFGMAAVNGIVIAGGQTEMETDGLQQASLLYMDNAGFRMTGGKFRGSAISGENAAGIVSFGVVLTGGEGKFYAQSEGFAVGMFNVDPVLYVSGGDFVFAGDTWAISDILAPGDDVDLRLTNVQTYVSEYVDSFTKRLWTSDADGRLVTIPGNFSPFLYVEFHGVGAAVAPQTGDHSMPWLWAGIAVFGLLGAAGLMAGRARKRRAESKR